MKFLLLAISMMALSQCLKTPHHTKTNISEHQSDDGRVGIQLGQYVVSAYEDSKGHLWFGTLQRGIARYDGHDLIYLSKLNGLPSDRITSVLEDEAGIFWFCSDKGLLRYNGNEFTNYKIEEDSFESNLISALFIDSKGRFWIGTWGGVYLFDGQEFTPFDLPYPDVQTPINQDTKDWITAINEDAEGNIWIARDGYGLSKYDGESFEHILKKDGLLSNNITNIQFDKDQNIWVGMRVGERDNPDPNQRTGPGGMNKIEKGKITSFPLIEDFNQGDVYEIYHDPSGNIWIGTVKGGVYKYDGSAFKHYDLANSITGMVMDSAGTLWLAGVGGLFKIDGQDKVINVLTTGPW